jgi:sugar O-acyltransferase (sialic acid O-acetyltransferase NeuD family)
MDFITKKLLIFGTGEIAELAYFYFTNDSNWKVCGFVCDDEYFKEKTFCNLPCIKFSEIKDYPTEKYAIHVALSYKKLNKIREEKYLLFKKLGYELPSYVSSKATVWSQDIGDNCLILEDQTIQPYVKIGNNVMLWSGNHLGHASVIEDHVYVSSHVVISGHCRIGARSFIGVNAAIKDFTTIGKDCFIGMGVNITRNCEDGTVCLPNKDMLLSANNKLASKIKKNYFGVQ